jgi:hypothetical protein
MVPCWVTGAGPAFAPAHVMPKPGVVERADHVPRVGGDRNIGAHGGKNVSDI